MKAVSLSEAQSGIARIMREVEAGERYEVTRYGKRVGCWVPASDGAVLGWLESKAGELLEREATP